MIDAASFSLSVACLLQALFFVILLASGQARSALWGQLLIALLIAISLEKADQVYPTSGFFRTAPEFALIGSVFGAAAPGLTYLHLRARTEPERRLTWGDSYAALPFLALGLYVNVSFHILPVEEKRALFETREICYPVNRFIILLAAEGDRWTPSALAEHLRLEPPPWRRAKNQTRGALCRRSRRNSIAPLLTPCQV